jgi:hypothetical protein
MVILILLYTEEQLQLGNFNDILNNPYIMILW